MNANQTIEKIWEEMQEPLVYLYSRWQDEKDYEDFSDYVKFAQNELDKLELPVKFEKLTQRPFALTYEIDKVRIRLGVTQTKYYQKVLVKGQK